AEGVGRGRKAAGMVARKVRRAWAADTGGVVVGGGAGCRNARSGRDGPRPETEPGSTRATRRGIAARRGDETAAGAHVSRVRRAGDASGAATARAGTGRSEAVGARGSLRERAEGPGRPAPWDGAGLDWRDA